jgi:hypothetical protein
MHHKLQLTMSPGVDAGGLALRARGCLSGAAYPVLLRAVVRTGRMARGPVTLDLRYVLHLDPDVLLHLRAIAGPTAAPQAGTEGPGLEFPRLTLLEPAELPVCLAHVAIDGAVLDQMDSGGDSHPAGYIISHDAGEESSLVDGSQFCQYYEGTLNPASTVRALSDDALGRLMDALYRHLDSPNPSFGARTWFELAADEIGRRGLQTTAAGPMNACPDRDNTAASECSLFVPGALSMT